MSNLKMPDINNILIAGNLTSEPTLRKTTNGTPVANFYVASNRQFRDNAGHWRENVCFVGVVAWYKLADSCHEYLRKGSAVLVEGELQSRSWKTSDGNHNNVVEIKARRIQFLNRKERTDGEIVELMDDENSTMNFDSREVLSEAEQSNADGDGGHFEYDFENLSLD